MKIFRIILTYMHEGIKKFLLSLIWFYKKCISPFLPNSCRYTPTCSSYMIEAIEVHGIIKGIWLGLKRILRCTPFGDSGYDPVPPKDDKKH